MSKEKKPKGCLSTFIKVFLITFIGLALIILLFSCFNNGNSINIDQLVQDAQNYITEIEDIHLGSQPNEEKISQLEQIQNEIAPTIEELETSKEENAYEFGSDFHLWEAYGGINLMCNNLKNYLETGSQESLNDYYTAKHAAEDNISSAIEDKNK